MRNLKASVSQLLANTLYQMHAKGASLNADFESPVTGYVVSVLDGPVYDSPQDINPIEVAQFIRENFERFDFRESYAGVWTDSETGMVYFDMVEVSTDLDYIMEMAAEKEQKAIWDVVNNCEIRV